MVSSGAKQQKSGRVSDRRHSFGLLHITIALWEWPGPAMELMHTSVHPQWVHGVG